MAHAETYKVARRGDIQGSTQRQTREHAEADKGVHGGWQTREHAEANKWARSGRQGRT